MNESFRLSKTEIDTVVMACAYDITARTASYNQAKVIDIALGDRPTNIESIKKVVALMERNNESDGDSQATEQRRDKRFQKVQAGLTAMRESCQKTLTEFPTKLAMCVGIQHRLLTTPTTPTQVTFSTEECEYVVNCLRAFEVAEIEPCFKGEVILATAINTDGVFSQQSEAEYTAAQNRKDELICLQAKFINRVREDGTSPRSRPSKDQ